MDCIAKGVRQVKACTGDNRIKLYTTIIVVTMEDCLPPCISLSSQLLLLARVDMTVKFDEGFVVQ